MRHAGLDFIQRAAWTVYSMLLIVSKVILKVLVQYMINKSLLFTKYI